MLFPHEAHCDPGRLVAAVGAAAIERGVRLRTGVEVRAIRPGAVDTGDEKYGRRIVSLRGGRVLSSSAVPLPWLLLGERSPAC